MRAGAACGGVYVKRPLPVDFWAEERQERGRDTL